MGLVEQEPAACHQQAAYHRPVAGQQGEFHLPVEPATGWVEPMGQVSRAAELGRRGRRVGVVEPREAARVCGLWARRRI